LQIADLQKSQKLRHFMKIFMANIVAGSKNLCRYPGVSVQQQFMVILVIC